MNDKLLSINGKDFTNAKSADYCALLQNGISDKNSIQVVFERANIATTYHIQKVDKRLFTKGLGNDF